MSIRRSGILVPLFSAPSERSWGIGDIGDLSHLTSWLAGAGQRVLQILPINEMAPSQQSPYSAISAMAIDPIYVDVGAIQEFAEVGFGSTGDIATLQEVRRASKVEYAAIRDLKQR